MRRRFRSVSALVALAAIGLGGCSKTVSCRAELLGLCSEWHDTLL